MAQRQQLVTPSPFKTPISSTSLPRLHTEVTQSPVSQIQNSVARILQFDESPERPRPKRLMERETDQPDSAMNPPDPKRALPPTTTESITTTATSNFFQALAMPPPKPTSVGSIQSPIAPSSPAVSIDYTSSPVMSPSPTNMSSANTLTASAYSTPPSSVHSSPSSSHTSPLHPPSEVGTPFSKSNVNSAPVDTPTPLQLHLANRVPHQTYSSYSAALAAQALLEENEVDTISPDQLREAFLSESSAMATALEDLVANVTDTSDLLHQLNLSLQMANNEVLLMNTSLMMDDRLHKLHQFFSGATA